MLWSWIPNKKVTKCGASSSRKQKKSHVILTPNIFARWRCVPDIPVSYSNQHKMAPVVSTTASFIKFNKSNGFFSLGLTWYIATYQQFCNLLKIRPYIVCPHYYCALTNCLDTHPPSKILDPPLFFWGCC